ERVVPQEGQRKRIRGTSLTLGRERRTEAIKGQQVPPSPMASPASASRIWSSGCIRVATPIGWTCPSPQDREAPPPRTQEESTFAISFPGLPSDWPVPWS